MIESSLIDCNCVLILTKQGSEAGFESLISFSEVFLAVSPGWGPRRRAQKTGNKSKIDIFIQEHSVFMYKKTGSMEKKTQTEQAMNISF